MRFYNPSIPDTYAAQEHEARESEREQAHAHEGRVAEPVNVPPVNHTPENLQEADELRWLDWLEETFAEGEARRRKIRERREWAGKQPRSEA